jgi:hypothetical protein
MICCSRTICYSRKRTYALAFTRVLRKRRLRGTSLAIFVLSGSARRVEQSA